jgi:hypothetical protein
MIGNQRLFKLSIRGISLSGNPKAMIYMTVKHLLLLTLLIKLFTNVGYEDQ